MQNGNDKNLLQILLLSLKFLFMIVSKLVIDFMKCDRKHRK